MPRRRSPSIQAIAAARSSRSSPTSRSRPSITNNVTLSTMHGCPPDEIERIARYLLEERGLHTIVKLNPTLLGKDAVLRILHDDLGFREIHIPDAVFEHDLQYERAVELIQSAASRRRPQRGLTFGVKLSNTLAMANHKGMLPGDEMYMSGRALYPITMNLFHKLAQEFDGDLDVSYSAGADALNVTTILACGARPVTAASDLLKPGGYCPASGSTWRTWRRRCARAARASLEELARDRLANLEARRSPGAAGPALQEGATIPTACPRSSRAWAASTASPRPAWSSARSARTCPSTPG